MKNPVEKTVDKTHDEYILRQKTINNTELIMEWFTEWIDFQPQTTREEELVATLKERMGELQVEVNQLIKFVEAIKE